jgi:hypothetical protein
MKRLFDCIFPKVQVCQHCSKSDKVEISYHDWCDRCKKITGSKSVRKFILWKS